MVVGGCVGALLVLVATDIGHSFKSSLSKILWPFFSLSLHRDLLHLIILNLDVLSFTEEE